MKYPFAALSLASLSFALDPIDLRERSDVISPNASRHLHHVLFPRNLDVRQLEVCAAAGQYVCVGGGCCDVGTTCATDIDGAQICSGGCGVAAVLCSGGLCCKAGSYCVTEGSQTRCEFGLSTGSGVTPPAVPPMPTVQVPQPMPPAAVVPNVAAATGVNVDNTGGTPIANIANTPPTPTANDALNTLGLTPIETTVFETKWGFPSQSSSLEPKDHLSKLWVGIVLALSFVLQVM